MSSLAHGLRATGLRHLSVASGFVSQKLKLRKRKSSLFPGLMAPAFGTSWPERCEAEAAGSGEAQCGREGLSWGPGPCAGLDDFFMGKSMPGGITPSFHRHEPWEGGSPFPGCPLTPVVTVMELWVFDTEGAEKGRATC